MVGFSVLYTKQTNNCQPMMDHTVFSQVYGMFQKCMCTWPHSAHIDILHRTMSDFSSNFILISRASYQELPTSSKSSTGSPGLGRTKITMAYFILCLAKIKWGSIQQHGLHELGHSSHHASTSLFE